MKDISWGKGAIISTQRVNTVSRLIPKATDAGQVGHSVYHVITFYAHINASIQRVRRGGTFPDGVHRHALKRGGGVGFCRMCTSFSFLPARVVFAGSTEHILQGPPSTTQKGPRHLCGVKGRRTSPSLPLTHLLLLTGYANATRDSSSHQCLSSSFIKSPCISTAIHVLPRVTRISLSVMVICRGMGKGGGTPCTWVN